MFPIAVTVIILDKIFAFFKAITAPFAKWLPAEIAFGFDGHNLFAIILLLCLCFISGLLFRLVFSRKGLSKFEDNVLNYIPGYILVRSIVAAKLHAAEQAKLSPIFLDEEGAYRPGLLVEEKDNGFCVVFIPDAPKGDSGEVKVVPVSSVKRLDIEVYSLTDSIRRMGRGLAAHAGEKVNLNDVVSQPSKIKS
jgi:uncharacterized membrane protein